MRPHPFQPRHGVFELRQLNGQSRLGRLGATGEYVENQFGPVEHLQSDRLFEIAGLAGRQIIVENYQIGVVGGGHPGEFLDFSASQISSGVGRFAALGY